MPYRRPGVTVTQEFAQLVPALALFTLPSVAVGPAYQLVSEDSLGNYNGIQQAYAYSSLLAGASVDLSITSPDDPFPFARRDLFLKLLSPVVFVLDEQATGGSSGTTFSDVTANQFANVQSGDLVVVKESLGVTLVAPQTDGQSTDTAGQRARLTAGTPGQFANVKTGDSVEITAGTNTNTGTFTVLVKASDSLLLLDSDINDGAGPATDVAYSITGDRGTNSAGSYRVKSVTDQNTLEMESPLPDQPEAPLTYEIQREIADVDLDRVEALPGNGFLATSGSVTLPAGLQTVIDGTPYEIASGSLEASYRALRADLASEVREYEQISDIEAVFGVGQIDPANPLAFALSVMKQNTVTAINGLALPADFSTNEVLAYQKAADVLSRTEMYAIALLTQNLAIPALFKGHVEGLSAPENKLERVAIFNSKLVTKAELSEETTTSSDSNGSRTIVNTQLDGAGNVALPSILTDSTTDQFLNVSPGDLVTIQSGSGVTPGTYAVLSITDVNTIILDANFVTTGTPSDIQYFIQRPDGLDANGTTVYDRNAQFITDGVSPGHQLNISAPSSLAGRYVIASVQSQTELTLGAAIPGVATSQNPLTYFVDRDLALSEQASLIAGVSASIGSRRMVHVWPDEIELPVGASLRNLPGYYLCAIVAALTSGLPTQQGLTNLSVSGPLGVKHSTGYFSNTQLNTISGGGTMVFEQDGEQQPLYVSHQLTTDVSAIKFQEYSVTKNVDFIAKFLRTTYAPFIGQYNIVDTTLDTLKTTATGAIAFLRDDTRVDKFGGVIRGGQLKELKESDTQIDTVIMRFGITIPIPLNNLDIFIEV